jgi:ribosomal protein S19
MGRDMCVDVKMEEGYMRMSIEFNNDESKNKISDVISEIEKSMKIYPSVIRRNINEHCGNFSVEFGIEDMNGRTSGEFCEAVMKKLGISYCQI